MNNVDRKIHNTKLIIDTFKNSVDTILAKIKNAPEPGSCDEEILTLSIFLYSLSVLIDEMILLNPCEENQVLKNIQLFVADNYMLLTLKYGY